MEHGQTETRKPLKGGQEVHNKTLKSWRIPPPHSFHAYPDFAARIRALNEDETAPAGVDPGRLVPSSVFPFEATEPAADRKDSARA